MLRRGVQDDWNSLGHDQFLRKYAPIIEFFLLVVVTFLALFVPSIISLTWQTVALIVLVIIVPYVPLIKRISYGDWEAELETLVRSAEESVEKSNVARSNPGVGSRADNLETILNNQLEEDPKLALAKLRMEIEEVLKRFAEDRGYQASREYVRFWNVVDFLVENEDVMDRDLYTDIRNVREVANEAIHGGEVSQTTAKRIVRLGLRVLERIYYETNREVNPDPTMPVFAKPEEEVA